MNFNNIIETLKISLSLLLKIALPITYIIFSFGIIYPLILLQTKILEFFICEKYAFFILLIEFCIIYVYVSKRRIIRIPIFIGIITLYFSKLCITLFCDDLMLIFLMLLSSLLLLKLCKHKIFSI